MIRRDVVWVTIHKPSGRAVVTGPRGGRWEWLALQANPKATWDKDWFGWVLDNVNQVSDLCTLANWNDIIYMEREWTPELLPRLLEKRRKKTTTPRRRVKKAA